MEVSGDVTEAGREDRATQLLICEALSLAKKHPVNLLNIFPAKFVEIFFLEFESIVKFCEKLPKSRPNW